MRNADIVEFDGKFYLVWRSLDEMPRPVYDMCDGTNFRLVCFGGYENAVEICIIGM